MLAHLRIWYRQKIFLQCSWVISEYTMRPGVYGAETWTLTASLISKFKVNLRAMERAMPGVSLTHRSLIEVITTTNVIDIARTISKLK